MKQNKRCKLESPTLVLLAILAVPVVMSSWAYAAESIQSLYETFSPSSAQVTIFVAKEVVTMSPAIKTVTAVAVRDGLIIDVGEKGALLARFNKSPGLVINRDFANKTLTPGLIDPHLHFWLFAYVANTHFITPADWELPWGNAKGVVGEKAYIDRLKEIDAELKDPNETLITWGYHSAFHGKMSRTILDKVSSTRPIIIWQRSVHEFYFNTKALEMLGIKESDWQGKGESSDMANWDKGHVWEKGLYLVVNKVVPLIASADKFKLGLERARKYIHAGGITAASDPGVAMSDSMIRQMIQILESGTMPFDYYLIPAGNTLYDTNGKDGKKAVAAARKQAKNLNGEHVKWLPNQIKLFTDGAVYSQLMQMKEGYLDGHKGEWIQSPEDFSKSARAFWEEGYQLTVHQNGDMGLELGLNTLEDLLHSSPRYDHRFAFHHFAFSERAQVKRAAQLGAEISSNPFYVHVLAEQYSKVGVGSERSEVMARGRTVIDNGIKLSFHSDAPMAPARPMLLAWAAVNRIGLSGTKTLGPEEKVTSEEAFRAVTINAAHAIRKENEMGSIDIGKKANFTVFEENPLTSDPKKLKDIVIWGTVFEGNVHPIKSSSKGLVTSLNNQEYIAMLAKYEATVEHKHHGGVCSANYIFQTSAAIQGK
ncbi:MAG: amidohydrolase family protein [Candidatus Endonucleobacter sp. (ex Gigantidas childressi)]|nr:amidohydrolase family protein [Candidatus Endonucleobacter sp. (ex Gigantidas childressi)]